MTKIKLKPIIRYYNNNIIECVYNVDKNGNKQGLYERYHENGQLDIKCTYKDGRKEGVYEEYHENGRLKEKSFYKNERKEGLFEEYYENGILKKRCTYKAGKTEGIYEEYHEGGQLYKKCFYKNAQKHGQSVIYSENESMISNCVFKNGKKLSGKEAEDFLWEWTQRNKSSLQRKGLNARLAQINKQMAATQLRQSVKRAEVAKFRSEFPNKNDGR